jgi:tetratricopeptide (TPR) repeat protein
MYNLQRNGSLPAVQPPRQCRRHGDCSGFRRKTILSIPWISSILAPASIFLRQAGYLDNPGRSSSSEANTYMSRGIASLNKADYNQAIQNFDKAIHLDPQFGDAVNNRGIAYESKGEYDRAIQDFNRAIYTNPAGAEAYVNRGLAYGSKGDYYRAIQDFDQAIRLNPNLALAYNNRGSTYTAKGDYDRGIQDLDQAIYLNSKDAKAYSNRGNSYTAKGDYDRAIEDFNQAIRLNPNFGAAYFNRGVARFLQGPVAAAVLDFTKSVELASTDRHIPLWLYVATARSGKKAAEVLGSAEKLDLGLWPGPISSLFLRKTDGKTLLEAAKNHDTKKERDQLCEAHFFLAEYEVIAGQKKPALAEFQEAATTCHLSRIENAAARVELKRFGQ